MLETEMNLTNICTKEELSKLSKKTKCNIARMLETLAFYADPDSYFAIAFFSDKPCGEFMDDFDEEYNQELCTYDRPMPGKRARICLKKNGTK
jgi:hypothetical protein